MAVQGDRSAVAFGRELVGCGYFRRPKCYPDSDLRWFEKSVILAEDSFALAGHRTDRFVERLPAWICLPGAELVEKRPKPFGALN